MTRGLTSACIHLKEANTKQRGQLRQYFHRGNGCSLKAVTLWSVVPVAFRCALMILAEDAVLNISASSAETRAHSERQRSIHMLMWATKGKKEKRGKKSSFMAIAANLHFMKPESTDPNQGFPPAEPECLYAFTSK